MDERRDRIPRSRERPMSAGSRLAGVKRDSEGMVVACQQFCKALKSEAAQAEAARFLAPIREGIGNILLLARSPRPVHGDACQAYQSSPYWG